MQINLGLQADLFLSTHFHGIIIILDGGQENHMTTEHALNLPVRNLSLCFSTESSHKLVLYPVSLVSYYFFHHCDDNHPFNVLTTQEDKHRPFKVLPLEFLYRLISDN